MIKKTLLSAIFAIACSLACTQTSQAQLAFNVDLSLNSALNANLNAPFYLDFQLNSGGVLGNMATISNFTFTGGAPTGSTTLFGPGSASGSLLTSVTLSDATGSIELFQQITSTTTDIKFQVTLTGNVNVVADEFTAAILDNSTFQVTTTAPDGISLITAPIDSTLALGEVGAYATTGGSTAPGIVASRSATVPEPSALVGVLGGIALLLGRRKRSL